MAIENSQIRQGRDGCRVQTRIQSSPTGKLRKLGRRRDNQGRGEANVVSGTHKIKNNTDNDSAGRKGIEAKEEMNSKSMYSIPMMILSRKMICAAAKEKYPRSTRYGEQVGKTVTGRR